MGTWRCRVPSTGCSRSSRKPRWRRQRRDRAHARRSLLQPQSKTRTAIVPWERQGLALLLEDSLWGACTTTTIRQVPTVLYQIHPTSMTTSMKPRPHHRRQSPKSQPPKCHSKHRMAVANEAVNLSVEESATISYDEDGNFNSMQVQGRIFLQITDKDQAKVKIHIAHQASSDFQFQTHPNIKKDAFFGVADPWLTLAKEDRAFPCGNSIGILKWRYQTSDDSMSPVSVTCWPSNQGGMTHCNLEYNLTGVLPELEDFVVRIPIPGSAAHAPEIIDVDGDTTFDSRTNELLWRIDTMDGSNDNGALEFSVPQVNHQEFFPVNVTFTSPTTLCSMEVLEVVDSGNAPARFSKQCAFKVDSYQVGSLQ